MRTTTVSRTHLQACMRRALSLVSVMAIAFVFSNMAWAADKSGMAGEPAVKGPPVPSLITATPEEGFALAVKLSQKGVVYTQPDGNKRDGLRGQYANDPNSLVAVSQVIAVHFQTVAAANNYWRK